MPTKTKNNKWVAYFQPASDVDYTKGGFSTKKEAIEYAKKFACELCLKEKNFRSSMCGCEWLFLKEKDFKKAKGHKDLWKAAGWKEVKVKKNETKQNKIKQKIL